MNTPLVECGERCVDCRRDCGRGSVLRDLAVPAHVERERTDGGPGLEERRGWLCGDCIPHLCDCGEVALGADVHWLGCAAGCGERVGVCPACWALGSGSWRWRCEGCDGGLSVPLAWLIRCDGGAA